MVSRCADEYSGPDGRHRWIASTTSRADGAGVSWPTRSAPVVVLVVLGHLHPGRRAQRLVLATIVLVVLPLAVRRAAPLAVLVIVVAAAVLTAHELAGDRRSRSAPSALASFTAGERPPTGPARRSRVIVVAAVDGRSASSPRTRTRSKALVLPFVVLVPTWLLGDILRTRRVDARASRRGGRAVASASGRSACARRRPRSAGTSRASCTTSSRTRSA